MSPAAPSHRLRVAHVVFSLQVGGLETGLINLLRKLDPAEFEHAIFCLKDLGANTEKAVELGATVDKVGKLEGSNRTIIWKLFRRFRKFRPDIVHTRNFGTVDAIIAARLARVPHVVHGEHGFDTFDLLGTSRKRRLVRAALSPFVDRYITVSDHMNAWLLGHRGAFRRKVVTVHNGVDVERFRPGPRTRQAGAPLVIGTVGRLAQVKDQASLIEAFAHLARKRSGVRLKIHGEGPLRAALEARAEASGAGASIELTGETSTPEVAYRNLDVFTLPSLNEGISNTILEAMASALPVVATAVGGTVEIVEDGETGILVPPANPEALAAALQSYLDHPELISQHGDAGRARVERRFSLSSMAAGYRKVYLDVCKRA